MSIAKRKLPINSNVFGECKDSITKMKIMLLYYWMQSICEYNPNTKEEFINFKNNGQQSLSAYRINKELKLSRKNIKDYLQHLIDVGLIVEDKQQEKYFFDKSSFDKPGYFQIIELEKLCELIDDCVNKVYGDRSSDGRVIWLYCKMAALANMPDINFSYYGLLKELGFSNKTKSTAVSDILDTMISKNYFDIWTIVNENDKYGNYKYVRNFGNGSSKEKEKIEVVEDDDDFVF